MKSDVKRPGNINVAIAEGSHTGCRAITFPSAEGMNKFFAENTGAVLVKVIAEADGHYFCLYTNELDDDQLFVLQTQAETIRDLVNKRVKEREDAVAKEKEVKAATDKELKRLAGIGANCEQNHKKTKEKK